MPPVRDDLDGYVLRLVRVAPGELTCVGCGEVAWGSYCPHCGLDDDGERVHDAPPLVPTVSYLREGEYYVAG